MSVMRNCVTGAVAAAMLVGSAAPAFARGGHGWGNWNGGGGYGRGWGRRHRDNDTGEVLGGILIGAILVGAIASASKAKKEREGTSYPDGRYPDNRDTRRRIGNLDSEDAAVDACASAAEERAGRTASVRDVDRVSRNGDGWDVEGVVESRDGWRDDRADKRRFTCKVRYGAVDSVYIDDTGVAMR